MRSSTAPRGEAAIAAIRLDAPAAKLTIAQLDLLDGQRHRARADL